MTPLQNPTPVTSRHLKVSVDPNSAFELAEEIPDEWPTTLTWQGKEEDTDFGACGLPIRERD
jgi:hypothetical protein